MASFLGGLGQGLGQIGLGVSRGELAGTAQQEKLRQLKAMQDYRQQLLAQQQHKLTQGDEASAERLKQQQRAPYQRALANPENWAFYHAPENAHILAEHTARAGFGPVDSGALPPDTNLDTATGEVRLPKSGLGGAPTAGAAAPAAPYTGPNTQPAPFDFAPPSESPFTLGQAGLAGPRSYNTPFDTAPSTQIQQPPPMPAVFPGEPAGGLPPYTPEPPAPGAGTPLPEPTPPPDPVADFIKEARSGNPRPGETPRQFTARLRTTSQALGLNIKDIMAGHQAGELDTRSNRNVSEAGLADTRNVIARTMLGPNLENLKARTSLVGAQEGQIRALTPERVNQIRSTITHQRNEEIIAARNAARSEAQYQEGVRHNKVTEQQTRERDQNMAAYRTAATSRIQTLLDNGDTVKMSPQDKAALQQQGRVYFAMHTDPLTGTINYQFDDNMRRSALQAMNGVLGKYKQAPIEDPLGGGTTNSAAPTGTLGPKHGSVGGAASAGGMSPPTMQEKSALKQMLGSPGGVHGWLQKATPDQAARVRHVFQSVFPGKSL